MRIGYDAVLSVLLGAWCVLGAPCFWSTSAGLAKAIDLDASRAQDDSLDPQALMARFQQPQEFTALCAGIRQRILEIDQRSQALEHTETSMNIEIDKKGKKIAAERVVERIWFDQGQEHRLVVKKEDTLTGRDRTPSARTELTPEKSKAIFPFGTSDTDGAYKYTLEGCDKVGNRQLLRIAFEPNEPLDVKFRGKLWVDPRSFEPVRFDGAWAKPPAFVDQMTQLLEFGPAENGATQCRRSVVAGSGGFAIIQKRFRVETDLADFRPRAEK